MLNQLQFSELTRPLSAVSHCLWLFLLSDSYMHIFFFFLQKMYQTHRCYCYLAKKKKNNSMPRENYHNSLYAFHLRRQKKINSSFSHCYFQYNYMDIFSGD